MGFDINILMNVLMCPDTGKPYYYGINPMNGHYGRVYGFPEVEVPLALRSYLEGRGHIFHAYTEHFNKEDRYNVEIHEFLDRFPTWETVQKSEYYDPEDDYWTEADHKAFSSLIQWCRNQQVDFRVSWSY